MICWNFLGLFHCHKTEAADWHTLKYLCNTESDWVLFFVTGHLIGLLESLGTLSITAIELKQLIGLLRLDEEENQVLM